MRRVACCLLVCLTGCQVDAPPESEPPAEHFVTAPVPRDLRPKRSFGPLPYLPPAHTARALDALDSGLAVAWDTPDPHEQVAKLFCEAGEVEPAKGRERLRATATRLRKLDLPPGRRVVWQSLAEAAAPWDVELRDELLWLAVADAQKALADEALWQPDPVQPGTWPLGNPRTLREFERQSLEYSVRLWGVVLEPRTSRAAAAEAVRALLAEAGAKGLISLGCISGSHEWSLARELADLDPELFLAAARERWGEAYAAQVCGCSAHRRWLDRRRDGITGMFVRYAVTHGVTDRGVIRVMGRYDYKLAWDRVAKLPDGSNGDYFSRNGSLLDLIGLWAWDDPEAALAAAVAVPTSDKRFRCELITEVGRVWAETRPETLDSGLKILDNDHWRGCLRCAATETLEWRKQGLPFRDRFDD